MLPFRFIKANPTTHLMLFRRGGLVLQGSGLSFVYFAPTASLVAVPTESRDVPFVFEKVSEDFQKVVVQGQLSYRIAWPDRTAASLNFALDGRTLKYESDDPEKLPERIVAIAQVLVQRMVQGIPLAEAIRSSSEMAERVLRELRAHAELETLGVEVQGVAILGISPTPETARALEARAREAILRQADEAIYARRNAAVENERAIKQSELDTEIAVEEKKRAIRETQMDAEGSVQRMRAALQQAELESDIGIEERRRTLVAAVADNTRTLSDGEAHRVGALLNALSAADPRIVQALAAMGMQPGQLIAQAFGGIAERAERIGQLNVSPDLLQGLLAPIQIGGGAHEQ